MPTPDLKYSNLARSNNGEKDVSFDFSSGRMNMSRTSEVQIYIDKFDKRNFMNAAPQICNRDSTKFQDDKTSFYRVRALQTQKMPSNSDPCEQKINRNEGTFEKYEFKHRVRSPWKPELRPLGCSDFVVGSLAKTVGNEKSGTDLMSSDQKLVNSLQDLNKDPLFCTSQVSGHLKEIKWSGNIMTASKSNRSSTFIESNKNQNSFRPCRKEMKLDVKTKDISKDSQYNRPFSTHRKLNLKSPLIKSEETLKMNYGRSEKVSVEPQTSNLSVVSISDSDVSYCSEMVTSSSEDKFGPPCDRYYKFCG